MSNQNTGFQGNQSTSVKWLVEIYPFDSKTPNSNTAGLLDAGLSIVASPALESKGGELVEGLGFGNSSENFTAPTEDSVVKSYGLQSVVINRSKSNPDSDCSFIVVGPLSPVFVVGNWVIVSSAQQEGSSKSLRSVIKFIGQIETIDISYSTASDGNVITRTNVTLREWSTILTSRLVFDARSVARSIKEQGGISAAALLSVGDGSQNNKQIETLDDLMADSFDPFETAHVVLRLMGMISAGDALEKAKKADPLFSSLAVAPPKVPPAVLSRLDMQSSGGGGLSSFVSSVTESSFDDFLNSTTGSGETQGAYANGFVTVSTGVQKRSVNNDGKWNGVFKDTSIKDYNAGNKKDYQKRPFKIRSLSVLQQLQVRFTAWQLLQQFCDPAVNEVYTDLWHEYKNGDPTESIVAKPVIVVRDKPFALKQIVGNVDNEFPYENSEAKDGIVANFTFYDDLPRVRIDKSSIMNINVKNTFLTSPNYIKVNYSSSTLSDDQSYAISTVKSILRLDPEQQRFGGLEYEPTAQFTGADPSSTSPDASSNKPNQSFEKWFVAVSEISRCWYAYQYRMGVGSITVKDDNYAISVGFNVQFQVGYFTLVGHVEGMTQEFTIDPAGNEISMMQIQLSRIVYVPTDGLKSGQNNLRLLPVDAWGRFFDAEYAKTANEADNSSGALGPVLNVFTDGVGLF